jgi:hypothetical protein
MTTGPSINQLTKKRDNIAHQISNREKEIARLAKRLTHSLTPNQKALLEAQHARQIRMLASDQAMLVNLETSLTTEIASQS